MVYSQWDSIWLAVNMFLYKSRLLFLYIHLITFFLWSIIGGRKCWELLGCWNPSIKLLIHLLFCNILYMIECLFDTIYYILLNKYNLNEYFRDRNNKCGILNKTALITHTKCTAIRTRWCSSILLLQGRWFLW
jgi:hypothetical protein